MIFFKANSEDPDETPYYVASHLGLRSLTMTHLWDASLKWVKGNSGLMHSNIVYKIQNGHLKMRTNLTTLQ